MKSCRYIGIALNGLYKNIKKQGDKKQCQKKITTTVLHAVLVLLLFYVQTVIVLFVLSVAQYGKMRNNASVQ